MFNLAAALRSPSSPISLNYIGVGYDTTNTSSYTFSSQSLGSVFSGRQIVIHLSWKGNSNSPAISSVTLAGDACTIIIQNTRGAAGEDNPGAAIAVIDYDSSYGTTEDIVVTTDAQCLNMAIGVTTMKHANLTAYDTDSDASNSSAMSLSLNTVDEGAILGTFTCKPVGDLAITNITELGEYDRGEGVTNGFYGNEISTGSTPLSLSANSTDGANDDAVVVASFQPK